MSRRTLPGWAGGRSRYGPPVADSPPVSTRCAGTGLRPLTRGPSSLLLSGGAAGIEPPAAPGRGLRATVPLDRVHPLTIEKLVPLEYPLGNT